MRYYGKIGYAVEEETSPDVWTPGIREIFYRGEVRRITRRLVSADKVNDDVNISNEISIVADAFAYQNFQNIRYIDWNGTKWKVSSVTVERPRLTLEIGGLYNGTEGPQVDPESEVP